VRSVGKSLGLKNHFEEKIDLHIHVPEGAVPKDGPSAGVTIATAIASELCKVPVRSNVAMTGEVTLRGKVLAIGGLREKTMAAYKNGMDVVIIPAANSSDIAELAPVVREHITFVTAEDMDTVLKNALDYPACKESKISVAASVPIDDRGFVGVGNEI
ncbi:MAG: endopeptidase La, partial [Clostridia bacterium]|nr:endopeptidase La [Clostridia bacterium]